ncbi:dimethylaniline monooxygenase [Wickerhamomyces ciferrii]|uniref:Dimethylaniline monooxygenase n=1 Tax=Wickerhamomyces ciferrii (strain ATCC 14091 / BCRC 22168 / CBS 111 / JCM 3599 / NBRC 0793 / NRRL Y-1031 F-60-10) TaxID=1206466 RepID=K0KJ44_WICCF|nr:dimethylaniline monooxygenase [Wickerhamomyces ciferrii]CCH41504.1 dimethylaniline monooxygenase [Wickerhamomyces ciferrii]
MVKKYSRIAIIGGGPTGLATAKALGVEGFPQIDLFERKDQVGGLWNYNGELKTKWETNIPNVHYKDEDKYIGDAVDEFQQIKEVPSPMYKHLETNLFKEMMAFKDFPFPKELESYPTRQEVIKYLENYSKTISKDVKFNLNSNVESVEKKADIWEVKVSINGSEVETRKYDAVVLANGHYNHPFIPDTKGIKEWNAKYPKSIIHCKYFDDCLPFKNKRVIVVGNSASGVDVAIQLTTSASKVLNSVRKKAEIADLKCKSIEEIDEIIEYDYENKTIKTINGDIFKDIDHIIYCTGYLYSFPFLKSYLEGKDALLTDGQRVRNLYKQLFYIPDPSLVFVGIPANVVIFPFSENQAAFVARGLSGRLKFPSEKEQRDEESERLKIKGDVKSFHFLPPPEDSQYCHDLQKTIDEQGLKDGFEGIIWDETKLEMRRQVGPRKAQRYLDVVEHVNGLIAKGEPFRLLREKI